MKGLLCIGGPYDGQWHIPQDESDNFNAYIRLEQSYTPRGLNTATAADMTSVRYTRRTMNFHEGGYVAFYALDGMSDHEIVCTLMNGYKGAED